VIFKKIVIMAITEVEKRIQQLEPKYLEALAEYVEYLLFLQKQKLYNHPKPQLGQVTETAMDEQAVPERLKIARKFAGDALYPHFPTSKYDVYEQ
jgi:hypothetical protein